MKTLHSLIAGLQPIFPIIARRIALPLLLLKAGLSLVEPCAGAPFQFEETGSLATARYEHTATLLPNGKVLVAGGFNSTSGVLASAELYDPVSGTWTAINSLATARYQHTATLLPSGKVLVAGGGSGSLASAELYDSADGSWTTTGFDNSHEGLRYHTATLLPSGKVLVAGGADGVSVVAVAEVYDPVTGIWTATGSLHIARSSHTATLLPNGKVLVAGGTASTNETELYNPATGTWMPTGSLVTARYYGHTATLLPNGKVLVAGGHNALNVTLTSAELYDPAILTWTTTGSLATARVQHTATLLPNGKVLVAGGSANGCCVEPLDSVELYDPASGTWTETATLNHARFLHTGTLLTDSKILVVDGYFEKTSELYDVGLGFSSDWQPEIQRLKLTDGKRLLLTGSLFQGVSQASGGNTQDSSSNYPVVQLRSIDNSEVTFLPVDPSEGWSDTSFSSLPVKHFPFGPALATVFTNGIPSAAQYLVVTPCNQ